MSNITATGGRTAVLNIQAFQNIMSEYQERKFSSGDLKSRDYREQAEMGNATHTGSTLTISPDSSDLIADVEIAARQVLKPVSLRYFHRHYASGQVVVQTQPEIDEQDGDLHLARHLASFRADHQELVARLDKALRTTLGQEFRNRGIAPMSAYLTPVDLRQRQTKGRAA